MILLLFTIYDLNNISLKWYKSCQTISSNNQFSSISVRNSKVILATESHVKVEVSQYSILIEVYKYSIQLYQ